MDDDGEEKSEESSELCEPVHLKKTKKHKEPEVVDSEDGEEEEEEEQHPNAVLWFRISEPIREKLKSKRIRFAQRKMPQEELLQCWAPVVAAVLGTGSDGIYSRRSGIPQANQICCRTPHTFLVADSRGAEVGYVLEKEGELWGDESEQDS